MLLSSTLPGSTLLTQVAEGQTDYSGKLSNSALAAIQPQQTGRQDKNVENPRPDAAIVKNGSNNTETRKTNAAPPPVPPIESVEGVAIGKALQQPIGEPRSTPVVGSSGPSVPAIMENHWWDITYYSQNTNVYHGEFVAKANTMSGLNHGDHVLVLPLNIAVGSPSNLVWFQFDLDFYKWCNATCSQEVMWLIWPNPGPTGCDGNLSYVYYDISLPSPYTNGLQYIPGDSYQYYLYPDSSRPNYMVFLVENDSKGGMGSGAFWWNEWPVPSTDLVQHFGCFSPATAIEGYTSSDTTSLTSVPFYRFTEGYGISNPTLPALYGQGEPLGIDQSMEPTSTSGEWYWTMQQTGSVESTVSAGTDSALYTPSSLVSVNGEVSGTVAGQNVLVQVYSPSGSLFKSQQVALTAANSYSYSFNAASSTLGTYSIVASYNGVSAATAFEVIPVNSDISQCLDSFDGTRDFPHSAYDMITVSGLQGSYNVEADYFKDDDDIDVDGFKSYLDPTAQNPSNVKFVEGETISFIINSGQQGTSADSDIVTLYHSDVSNCDIVFYPSSIPANKMLKLDTTSVTDLGNNDYLQEVAIPLKQVVGDSFSKLFINYKDTPETGVFYGIPAIQVLNAPDTTPPSITPPPSKSLPAAGIGNLGLCQNLPVTGPASVTSSGNEAGNIPSNIIDNSLSTRWSNLGVGSWVRLDLGSPKVVCNVEIGWYQGTTRTNNFILSVSTDGIVFKDVFIGKSGGATLSQEKYEFSDSVARYLKITVNGNSVNNWASITEVDANGYTTLGLPIVSDNTDPSPLVQNSVPASGLPVGTTLVNWIAKDAAGNSASAQQSVTVADTTPPTVTASPKGALYTSAQSVSLSSNEPGTIYYTTNGATPTTSSIVYSTPILISTTTTLKFLGKDGAGNIGAAVTEVYTINIPDTTPPVVSATPAGGIYNAPQQVILSANEPSTIYYSTNGATPTILSPTYSSPIPISTTTTLKYFAQDTAGNSGMEQTQAYTIDTLVPTASATPAGGLFNTPKSVTLTASEAATIYYTTDGTAPTTSSATYSSPIAVSTTTTLKFFGKDAAGNSGAVVTEQYTIDSVVPTASATPVGGTYGSAVSVTLTASEAGTIFYTTDGTTPTTSSAVYGGPIPITTSKTLKFFAKDNAGNAGAVETEIYTISDVTKPSISITAPTGGSTLTSSVPVMTIIITGTASDLQSGVQKVEVRMKDPDGILTAYQPATPNDIGDWSSWSSERLITKAGLYTIYAKVTDNAGNQNWIPATTFSVSFVTADITKPLVKITSPTTGSTFSGLLLSGVLVSIDGTASDPGSGIQKVEVRAISPAVSTSYKLATPIVADDWSGWVYDHLFTASGTYTFSAKATDKAGNVQWSIIQVTINLT